MLWLGVAYLLALGALFITSLWSQNDFTGTIERIWTLDNFRQIWDIPVYRTIAFRTIGIAALVTVIDAVIAFPIALYMAKVASPRGAPAAGDRGADAAVGVVPGEGVRLARDVLAGRADRLARRAVRDPVAGLRADRHRDHAGLPVAALHGPADLRRAGAGARLAARGLGRPRRGRAVTTLRRVVLPMAFPAIVAGSIFTFSLSLGDYIAVQIVGGTHQLLGNVIYDNVGSANNLPFAAALSTIPVVVMFVYLAAARRTGALENL